MFPLGRPAMDTNLAALVVAAIAAILGWVVGHRTERAQAGQYRVTAAGFAADWFRDLRTWASEAIDVLSEAGYCASGGGDPTPMDTAIRLRCRHRLSALIDRGRFFIPNYVPDEVGTNKPVAFRGLRHPAIDYLVAAENVLAHPDAKTLGNFPSQRVALTEIKRQFVSEIQEILDPRTQNKAIADLLRVTAGDSKDSRSALERLNSRQYPETRVP
jgi:hypothetical protein